MRERMNICAALTALLLHACHPDPACSPGAAAKREAACMRMGVQECALVIDTEACLDNVNRRCDQQAELHEAQCTR